VLATPSISSLSPTTGAVGASVTIGGSNFGSTQGSGTVKFNGTAGTVSSWSASSIVATVPSGATTRNVIVNASGVNANGVSFTVVSAPSISSLTPSTGAVGASVTIAGANFGSTQGTSTVKFNQQGLAGLIVQLGQAPFYIETERFDSVNHVISVVTLKGHPLAGWRYWRVYSIGTNDIVIETGAYDQPGPGPLNCAGYFIASGTVNKAWYQYLKITITNRW
jgi:hypothetical protein